MSKNVARVLALWHALDSTELGLTKQDLRDLIPGYSRTERDDAAFEKQFTRDKNHLRALGAEIDAFSYRSGPERYRLIPSPGPVVDLTLAEAAVVRLGASIWAAGELSDDANEAADKVTSDQSSTVLPGRKPTRKYSGGRSARTGRLQPPPLDPAELEALSAANDAALIAHVPASSSLIKPLLAAISERRRVRFGYRSGASGKTTSRLVEPWRVAFRDGGWYLLGRDAEIDFDLPGERAFRLSRVVGEIKSESEKQAFPVPAEIDVATLLGETTHSITATLALLPGRGARLRALGTVIDLDDLDGNARAKLADPPQGYETITFRYDDERELADELAGLGPNVVVLGPPQLRNAVVTRLRAAAAFGEDGAKNANN